MATEFDIIADYFSWPQQDQSVALSVGDDAALVRISENHELVISVDTLVSGIHYPPDTPAASIAYKALMVNLSDLAAMGAKPKWFTLALTLPEQNKDWLSDFSKALRAVSEEYNVALIGGDTTRGSETITIQMMGEAEKGQSLQRSRALSGDLLCLTHSTGDAGAGLAIYDQHADNNFSEAQEYCLNRLMRPTARVKESKVIKNYANACIDVSDGLLQDLSHLLKASQLGAVINTDTFKLSSALDSLYPREEALKLALSSGDDYELLFTIPETSLGTLAVEMDANNYSFQVIGQLNSDINTIRDQAGSALNPMGFQHF